MTAWLPPYLSGPATVVAVIAAAYLLGRFIVAPVTARLVRRRSPPLARPLSRAAHYLTLTVGVLAGLSTAGYGQAFGAMGAVLAAGTFALGFAMKDTLSALVSGVFILVDRPFQIGDWIEWDGNEGKVVDIALRTTRVETFDNEMLTVPNDRIINTTVKNRTARDKLRMTTTFGIGYGDDIDEAKDIIMTVLEEIDGIATSPGPSVRLRNLGDSAIELKAFYWIDDPKRAKTMRMQERLLRQVKERFEAAGIDMPYPTQTITGAISVDGS